MEDTQKLIVNAVKSIWNPCFQQREKKNIDKGSRSNQKCYHFWTSFPQAATAPPSLTCTTPQYS